jgi:hypothetical protein
VFAGLLCKLTRCAALAGRAEVSAELGEVADASRRLELFSEIQRVECYAACFLDVPGP